MEVPWHEQIERSSLGDALLEEENCRCGSGQGRSLGALGEVLLEVVDGDAEAWQAKVSGAGEAAVAPGT